MPFIGKTPETGAYQLIDSITTSATATYALTVDGLAYFPASARNLIVSLNGVTQAPESAYTVSGSDIVFASALTASDVIDYILVIGDAVDIGTPSDGTVGTSQLASSIDLSGKTLTFANDQISGDAIDGGTATLDGLTVDTDTLVVDSTNNRVGIGGSPSCPLHVKNDDFLKVIVQDVSGTDTPFSIGSAANALTISNNASANTDDEAIVLNQINQSAIFFTAGTERMRIDSSGNVGINTISASGPQSTFHIEQNGDDADGGFRLSRDNALASYTQYINTSSIWNLAYGNPSSDDSPTDILSVTTTGNVGIGTASPARNLTVSGTGARYISVVSTDANAAGILLGDNANDAACQLTYVNSDNSLRIHTNGSEKMRLDASGNLGIGKSNPTRRLVVKSSGAGTSVLSVLNSSDTSEMFLVDDISGSGRVRSRNSSNTTVFQVDTDGDVTNTNNSYGAISDERLKSNIVDASSQLDDIMAVQVRSYTLNSTGETHIGVVAQELEASGMSGLVQEDEDGMKSVKYSVLYMKAIKAIQEQQAMIETLQAQVAELQGA